MNTVTSFESFNRQISRLQTAYNSYLVKTEAYRRPNPDQNEIYLAEEALMHTINALDNEYSTPYIDLIEQKIVSESDPMDESVTRLFDTWVFISDCGRLWPEEGVWDKSINATIHLKTAQDIYDYLLFTNRLVPGIKSEQKTEQTSLF